MSDDTTVYDDADQPTGEELEPVTESAPVETPEAPAPDIEAKKTPALTPEQQEAVDQAIGKKVAKQREAERQAEEARRELLEAQQRLQQYERPIRPDIPAPPDPYEDNFAAKVAHRDAMIAKAAEFDAQIRWQQQQEQARQQQTIAEERAKVVKTVESYSETASKLGITADELQEAGAKIAPYMPDKLALRILNDASGPEITTYLARNLVELDKVTRMDAMDAAVYLETVIKPKSKRAPVKLPPEPTESLSGAAMREGQRGPRGVVYE
jgi:DNA repair exonuclease SbcCD ATPase subunit